MNTRFVLGPVLFLSTLTLCLGLTPLTGNAADGQLTLTVTPPLFQLNLRPGETWTSGITVVNSNPYNLTVYAEPKLFRPTGEEGRPEFIEPPGDDLTARAPDPTTLAGWITVPTGPIEIAREQTAVIPLAIDVPADAQPGGHYAAILVGNRPPSGVVSGGTVSVASSIASLIVLRVAGDVDERGRIREFSTERTVYESPDARFTLRFENQGNVHLQPKGYITIYNMFGKKRGFIEVNQNGSFGNVLPGSIRRFDYAWSSDAGTWDIGRYKAEATLAYGEESKSFANATQYFYILPIVPLLEVVGAVLLFVVFILWALRAYVRRALAIETARLTTGDRGPIEAGETVTATGSVEQVVSLRTFVRPIQEGLIDLRTVAGVARTPSTGLAEEHTPLRTMTFRMFLRTYAPFLVFVILAAAAWVAASAFFSDVLTYERTYEVREVRGVDANIEGNP